MVVESLEQPFTDRTKALESTIFGSSMPSNIVYSEGFISAPDAVFRTERLTRAYRYWWSKREGGKLPGRADIDPVDIPDLLPGTLLSDVIHEPDRIRFRVRLAGQYHVDVTGRNPTGDCFDDVDAIGDDVGGLLDCYRAVVKRGTPHYWIRKSRFTQLRWSYYERILLPLAADGETVDMMICFMEPFSGVDNAPP